MHIGKPRKSYLCAPFRYICKYHLRRWCCSSSLEHQLNHLSEKPPSSCPAPPAAWRSSPADLWRRGPLQWPVLRAQSLQIAPKQMKTQPCTQQPTQQSYYASRTVSRQSTPLTNCRAGLSSRDRRLWTPIAVAVMTSISKGLTSQAWPTQQCMSRHQTLPSEYHHLSRPLLY